MGCRYSLRDAGHENGLIIARIAREAGGRWGFHALGLPCRGRTYKDSIPQLRAACKVKTQSLMLRTQHSSSSLGSAESAHSVRSQIVQRSQLNLPSPFEPAGAKPQRCASTLNSYFVRKWLILHSYAAVVDPIIDRGTF